MQGASRLGHCATTVGPMTAIAATRKRATRLRMLPVRFIMTVRYYVVGKSRWLKVT